MCDLGIRLVGACKEIGNLKRELNEMVEAREINRSEIGRLRIEIAEVKKRTEEDEIKIWVLEKKVKVSYRETGGNGEGDNGLDGEARSGEDDEYDCDRCDNNYSDKLAKDDGYVMNEKKIVC